MNLKIDKTLFIQINIAFTILIIIGLFIFNQRNSIFKNEIKTLHSPPLKYKLTDTPTSNSFKDDVTVESEFKYKEDINLKNIQKEIKTHTEFLFVNSKFYDQTSGTITLKDLKFKNVIGLELYSYSFPKSTYVINSQNNQFIFKDDTDNSFLITLSIGDYDALSLCTELQNKIRAATTNSINVTYVESLTGIKFSNVDAFTLEFSKILLQYNLGFKDNINTSELISGNQVLQSTGRIDLFNNRYVQIRSPQLKKFYGNTDIVALLNTENPINYNMYDQQQREFLIACDYLKKLTFYLETVNPYAESTIFQTNNLGFHLCFIVKSLVETPKNLITKKLYF